MGLIRASHTHEEDGLIIRDLRVVTEAITWESQVVKTHLMINAQVRASRLSLFSVCQMMSTLICRQMTSLRDHRTLTTAS